MNGYTRKYAGRTFEMVMAAEPDYEAGQMHLGRNFRSWAAGDGW